MATISNFSFFLNTGSIPSYIFNVNGKFTEYIRLLIVVMVGIEPPALNFTVVIGTGSFEPTEPAFTVYCMLSTKQPQFKLPSFCRYNSNR